MDESERADFHLYKNNHDGTFTDVTEKSGIGRTGWQTGVFVGDYDNDGWDDLFCGFWRHNILFHNNGDGTFTDVTLIPGLYREAVHWGSWCAWLDYDRDGHLDSFVWPTTRHPNKRTYTVLRIVKHIFHLYSALAGLFSPRKPASIVEGWSVPLWV